MGWDVATKLDMNSFKSKLFFSKFIIKLYIIMLKEHRFRCSFLGLKKITLFYIYGYAHLSSLF
ncbi:hypothetical protein CWO92_24445 [Heyndrickxia camelliae]|uniref:Uncharacterized protein n=1 Tax=Heyndrickxia camelliae TaxID=1707093 RepID=A0A2N3LCU3_9BACI|nr:hypothetical protein CWO92_24445 [Heyndrickxia camelliae]